MENIQDNFDNTENEAMEKSFTKEYNTDTKRKKRKRMFFGENI